MKYFKIKGRIISIERIEIFIIIYFGKEDKFLKFVKKLIIILDYNRKNLLN